ASRCVRAGLGVLLVGDDPASAVYVRSKPRACEELGLHHETAALPASASTLEVMARVDDYTRRPEIDGILVQLPLPPQVDTERVLRLVGRATAVAGVPPETV